MKLFFILGNQLFPLKYLDRFKKDHVFFMAEDNGLCTYEKHHKQKILLFLSSMRSYADRLKKEKYKLDYLKIEDKDFKDDYFKKLKKIITKNKITEISSFEVEDKFFEKSESFALYPTVDGTYYTYDELYNKIKAKQTDKDDKLVILYASSKDSQHSYIEAAKAKGYEVLLLDSPIVSHLIQNVQLVFHGLVRRLNIL